MIFTCPDCNKELIKNNNLYSCKNCIMLDCGFCKVSKIEIHEFKDYQTVSYFIDDKSLYNDVMSINIFPAGMSGVSKCTVIKDNNISFSPIIEIKNFNEKIDFLNLKEYLLNLTEKLLTLASFQ
jgi:hypothetical protein